VAAESLRALVKPACVRSWLEKPAPRLCRRTGLRPIVGELLRFFLVKKGEHVSWNEPKRGLDLLACPAATDLELRGNFSGGVWVVGVRKEYPIKDVCLIL